MDNKRKEILDKIAKLIALAEGTNNEAEATAARNRVTALLSAHNLELGMLRNDQKIVVKTIDLNRSKMDHLMSSLHSSIAEFSGCTLLNRRIRGVDKKAKCYYIVLGREVDIDATEYMLDVINRQTSELCATYKKTKPDRKRFNGYKAGLVAGVSIELERITKDVLKYQQQEGLVPVNEMKVRADEALEWFKKNNKVYSGQNYKGEMTPEGYEDGMSDAAKVQLRAPVTNQNSDIFAIEHR
jgi:hypothetical protein